MGICSPRRKHKQASPALKTKIDSKKWAEYDTIILGYTICSHGGGRFGQSLTAISKLAPKAKLTAGLSIHYSGGASLSKDVEKWLKKCGVKE